MAERASAERLPAVARVAVLLIAVTVQLFLCSAQLIRNWDRYRPPWPEPVAFGLLLLVAAGCGGFLARGRAVPGRVCWAGVVAVFAASVLASLPVAPSDYLSPEHWSFGLIGWYVLALLFDRSPRTVGGVLGGHLVLTASTLFLAGGVDAIRLAAMGITAISALGYQFAVGLAAGLIRRIAVRAGEAAEARERASTAEAVAEQVHHDHRERYNALLGTTVPLLRGLADGSLDPADEDVARRCGTEAARMRRLFAEGDDVPDPLVHELAAVIDLAERNGVSVRLAVRGEPCALPKQVRRELLDAAAAVLASAASAVRVTVVRTPEQVRVSALGDVAAVPEVAEPMQVQVNRVGTTAGAWVEAVWQPAN
ncbi:hypothetical protein GCM10022222_55200 [Amycolatopsis ultiminotia]|uniref:Signal transduction histidine kinase n=1 Tax=Amycolatopsis ultiminotia TaxID=543629 RepID=A0ABP6XDJ6_9PSEU